jgi:hypothetical protein
MPSSKQHSHLGVKTHPFQFSEFFGIFFDKMSQATQPFFFHLPPLPSPHPSDHSYYSDHSDSPLNSLTKKASSFQKTAQHTKLTVNR